MKALLVFLALIVGTAHAQYAQLSSPNDQRALPDEQPSTVVFDVADALDGISILEDGTAIQILVPGLYFQIWAPQVDRGGSAKAAWMDLWTSTNDIADANSNVRVQFAPGGKGATTVIPAQSVACLNGGDIVRVLMSGSNTDVGLVAIEPDGEPRIPAIIGTIFRVGDC